MLQGLGAGASAAWLGLAAVLLSPATAAAPAGAIEPSSTAAFNACRPTCRATVPSLTSAPPYAHTCVFFAGMARPEEHWVDFVSGNATAPTLPTMIVIKASQAGLRWLCIAVAVYLMRATLPTLPTMIVIKASGGLCCLYVCFVS